MSQKLKKESYIEVKQGTLDPDYEKYDMSGWKGLVTHIEQGEEVFVHIHWDSQTLKQLPEEFIKQSIIEGYQFAEMSLVSDDVMVIPKGKNMMKDKAKIITELEISANVVYQDPDDEDYAAILQNENVEVNTKNLKRYRAYLIKHLEKTVFMTGIQDFPWEERFVFGYGSDEEYEEMRKTRASYADTFQLIKILDKGFEHDDLFVEVRREHDKQKFTLKLSNLEGLAADSNTALLHGFSVWAVNY